MRDYKTDGEAVLTKLTVGDQNGLAEGRYDPSSLNTGDGIL